jgi:hypothetical protein
MACLFRVAGRTFDVDHFLQKSTWDPVYVWRRGEPDRGRRIASSGFNVEVSVADLDDFQRQQRDAIRFLRRKVQAVLRLNRRQDVDTLELDFAIQWRTGLAMQTDRFSPELVTIAGRCHVGLAIRHCAVRS